MPRSKYIHSGRTVVTGTSPKRKRREEVRWQRVQGITTSPVYYVDATSGSDSANGRSAATAWQTIAKVNASTFNSGDQVLFKRGEMWREQLTVPSSDIALGSFGSGALPVLNASDITTGWTVYNPLMDDANCQAAWTLEDATPLTDFSGNANTLTAVNGAAVSDGYFTPANNVIFTRADPGCVGIDGMASGTFYAKFQSLDASLGGVFSKRNVAGQKSWGMRVNSSNVQMFLSADGTAESTFTSAASSITAGVDYTAIVTVDAAADEVKIYIDGTQSGSTGSWTGASLFDGTSTLRLGCDGDGNEMQGGRIYEAGVFDDVLSASEIAKLHTYGLSGNSVYSKAWASNDVVVVEDGTRLAKGTSAVLSAGYFWQSAGVLYICCTDSADPSTHTIEVANRTYCIDSNGADNITIDSLTLKYAKDLNIRLNGATGWNIQGITSISPRADHILSETAECGSLTISGCTFQDPGQEHVYLGDTIHTSGTVIISDNTFENGGWNLGGEGDAIDIKANNTASILVSNNTITFTTGFTATTSLYGVITESPALIEDNTINNSVRGGIKVAVHNGSIVRKNKILQTRTGSSAVLHGIEFDGDNHQIYNNLIVCTGDTSSDLHGLHGGFSAAHIGLKIYHNTVIGWKRGFYNDDDLTTCEINNNIFQEWTDRGILLGSTPTSLVCDYNDIYSVGGNYVGRINGVDYTALADWQGATTYDDNSLSSDSVFVTNYTDLHLQVTSPCRAAGATGTGVADDYDGVARGSPPDIGAFEYVA